MTAKNKKPIGLTKETGWQIGLRRTLPFPYELVWELITSSNGVEIWLGKGDPFDLEKGVKYQLEDGTTGEVRVVKSLSHLRITRLPLHENYDRASTIQIRVLEKGEKTELVFHEEHLPNQEERQARKVFYLRVVDQIRNLLS
jgi:uncharacterized protein YndB with AHSA1/START domain